MSQTSGKVTAKVFGTDFDNAGAWGHQLVIGALTPDPARPWVPSLQPTNAEMWVVLYQDRKPVAEVNLATLFAFACGTLKG